MQKFHGQRHIITSHRRK